MGSRPRQHVRHRGRYHDHRRRHVAAQRRRGIPDRTLASGPESRRSQCPGSVTRAKPHRHRNGVETWRVVTQREYEQYADAALQSRLDIATTRLAEEFDGVYDRETIKTTVQESARSLSPNGVTPYVHILAERFTRERLRAQAQTDQ